MFDSRCYCRSVANNAKMRKVISLRRVHSETTIGGNIPLLEVREGLIHVRSPPWKGGKGKGAQLTGGAAAVLATWFRVY